MFNKPLQPFLNVAASATATLRIPPEPLTLVGILFELGGTTFDTSLISTVKVKVGPRTTIDVTGAQALAISGFKGESISSNKRLYLDMTEQNQALFPQKEVGGYDLMALLPQGEVTVEVAIGAATAPTLKAFGFFTPAQGNNIILKLLPFSFPAGVTDRNTLPLNLRGALLKRLYLGYTGTDWTSSANGNLNRLEIKRNGLVIHDMGCLSQRSLQTRSSPARAPQSKFYVFDPSVDDNPAGYVTTQDRHGDQLIAAALEVNPYLTATDTISCLAEVLDQPGNL